jgi:hypothetical protein
LCIYHITLEKLKQKRKNDQNVSSTDEEEEKTKNEKTRNYQKRRRYKLILNNDDGNNSGSELNEQNFLLNDSAPKVNDSDGDDENDDNDDENEVDDYLLLNSEPHQMINDLNYEKKMQNLGVYNRNEIIKLFNCKLTKLENLYKKQLAILSDKLVYDRKKFLLMNNKSDTTSNNNNNNSHNNKLLKAAQTYKSHRPIENYLKEKYDPINLNSTNSLFYSSDNNNRNFIRCRFESTIESKQSRCSKQTVPLSKYCVDRKSSSSFLVFFFK